MRTLNPYSDVDLQAQEIRPVSAVLIQGMALSLMGSLLGRPDLQQKAVRVLSGYVQQEIVDRLRDGTLAFPAWSTEPPGFVARTAVRDERVRAAECVQNGCYMFADGPERATCEQACRLLRGEPCSS